MVNTQGDIEDITPNEDFGYPPNPDRKNWAHGTAVMSKIVGARLGICRRCNVVFIGTANDYIRNPAMGETMEDRIGERVLKQLHDALDHIMDNDRVGKAVINMSFGYPLGKQKPVFFEVLCEKQPLSLVSHSTSVCSTAILLLMLPSPTQTTFSRSLTAWPKQSWSCQQAMMPSSRENGQVPSIYQDQSMNRIPIFQSLGQSINGQPILATQ